MARTNFESPKKRPAKSTPMDADTPRVGSNTLSRLSHVMLPPMREVIRVPSSSSRLVLALSGTSEISSSLRR